MEYSVAGVLINIHFHVKMICTIIYVTLSFREKANH